MKWTEYPTRAARNNSKGGLVLEGAVISPAAGGGHWVLSGGAYHQVRGHEDAKYCIAEECPPPPAREPDGRVCMVCGATDAEWAPSDGLDGDICTRCQPALFAGGTR